MGEELRVWQQIHRQRGQVKCLPILNCLPPYSDESVNRQYLDCPPKKTAKGTEGPEDAPRLLRYCSTIRRAAAEEIRRDALPT
jgi:hypothetical protein